MENALDALKMAAAMLVFLIAITVSFSLFNKAKATADSIVTMRDRQGYLTAEEVDGHILYTSSEFIATKDDTIVEKLGVNKDGDRIVSVEDVIATITRYSKEKYGVTVVLTSGEVVARFDSNTENIVRNWNNIDTTTIPEEYSKYLENNTFTRYAAPKFWDGTTSTSKLKTIYSLNDPKNGAIICGAPWYGNSLEINKRISAEISGKTYTYNGQSFTRENLKNVLASATKIIEVTNEIDNSKYLKYTESGTEVQTSLLEEYEMPTIEVIYIIYT